MKRTALCLLITALLLASCALAQVATPAPTATALPSPTPPPTASATPTPIPTLPPESLGGLSGTPATGVL